jgi:hypothetical protein
MATVKAMHIVNGLPLSEVKPNTLASLAIKVDQAIADEKAAKAKLEKARQALESAKDDLQHHQEIVEKATLSRQVAADELVRAVPIRKQ